ncbi:MAG: SulP family inorganic anion transporter [Sulfitobacter sp.]
MTHPDNAPRSSLQYFGLVVGLLVIPAMSVAFAISFAAIVFKGPLEPFLGQGISLTLLGAAVMGLMGSLFFSFRGTISGPQDVTSILLSGAAVSVALAMPGALASDLLSTLIILIVVASVTAGAAAFLFGKLRLGYLARFVPYPVIGGFLAATGYLLLTSALGMMVGHEVTIYSMWPVLSTADPLAWLPWLFSAACIAFLLRRGTGVFTLPVAMLACIAFFYLALYLAEMSLTDAEALLLGPFEEVDLGELSRIGLSARVDWMAIVAQTPTLIAVAGLTILGTLLNSTGIELTVGEDSDFEKDLRAAGITNMASGLVGGLPGYQLIGETILARDFGMMGRLPGIVTALGCALALLFGTSFLGYIPAGAIAMLIAYLGIDLLLTWIWDERRRLSARDFGIILLIVAVAAFVGFLEALAVGLFAAMAIFVISYARLNVVRLRSTAATKRSRVERSDTELRMLGNAGQGVIIFELTGYIFFGTANTLTEDVRKELQEQPTPAAMILDFSRLSGFDASAAFALRKLVRACQTRGVRCVFAGMRADLLEQYQRATPRAEQASLHASLDTALVEHENSALADVDVTDTLQEAGSMLAFAEGVLAREVVPAAVTVLTLERDDLLVEEGSTSKDIFILRSGVMRAEVEGPDGNPLVIARFQPGALIGEIAYYAAVPRTATLAADTTCTLYRFEPDRLADDDLNLSGELHNLVASHIARRLVRSTQLIKDAGI